MNFRSGKRAEPQPAKLSLVGGSLPERIRALTFALLGLITAAGLGLVFLFSQTSLPIPSLGPVTGPLAEHQTVHGGIALGAGRTSRADSAKAGSAPTSSLSPPLVVPVAAGDFAAAGAPRGDGVIGAAAGEGPSIAGNDQEVPAVQPQPTAVGPTPTSGSTGADGAVEPAPVTTPVSEPVVAPPPGPGIPTSEEPPVEEPEAPEPPVGEVPEGETPEEPPVTEPPAEDEGEGGFLEAVGGSRTAG
jgi:hypothetical protein